MAQPGSSDAVCERLVGWIASWTWLSTCKTAERAWLWRNENESRFSAAWLTRDTTVYALGEGACKIHETKHQMHLACSWWFKQPINNCLYKARPGRPDAAFGWLVARLKAWACPATCKSACTAWIPGNKFQFRFPRARLVACKLVSG
jgi:hypothetical protein